MAKQLNFDLGQTSDGPCCAMTSSAKETYYPSFHHSGDEKLDVPDEGTMLVRYKKVSSSQSEDKRGEHYSCCIEVQEIISVSGDAKKNAPSRRDKSGEEALDAHMAAREKESY